MCLSLSPQTQAKKVANVNLENTMATSKKASNTQLGHKPGHEVAMAG